MVLIRGLAVELSPIRHHRSEAQRGEPSRRYRFLPLSTAAGAYADGLISVRRTSTGDGVRRGGRSLS